MSEETTETASKPEESETVSQVVDSATTEEQPSGEAQNAEKAETVNPNENEEASESAQQPVDSELEKALKAAEKSHKSAANANIKARKLERKVALLEAANTQETTRKAEPQATPELEVPEDLLYDPDKTAGYIKSSIDTAIQKDRKEQDEIRKVNVANQERESFFDKSDELAESDEEYSELVESSDDVQLSSILKNRLMKSEVGAKLHKHVLANPDILLKINNLSLQYPKAANDEIAKIEASLADKSQGHKPIKETAAPKVIETVGGGSGKVPTSADAGSMDEYYDRRMAERRANEAALVQ